MLLKIGKEKKNQSPKFAKCGRVCYYEICDRSKCETRQKSNEYDSLHLFGLYIFDGNSMMNIQMLKKREAVYSKKKAGCKVENEW